MLLTPFPSSLAPGKPKPCGPARTKSGNASLQPPPAAATAGSPLPAGHYPGEPGEGAARPPRGSHGQRCEDAEGYQQRGAAATAPQPPQQGVGKLTQPDPERPSLRSPEPREHTCTVRLRQGRSVPGAGGTGTCGDVTSRGRRAVDAGRRWRALGAEAPGFLGCEVLRRLCPGI